MHAFNGVVAWRSYREAWIKAELDTAFLDRGWAKHVCDPDESGVYNRRLLEVAAFSYLQGRGLPDNTDAFVTELRDWLNSHIRNLDSFVGELGVVESNPTGLPIVRRPLANKPTDSALALEKALLERLPQRTIPKGLYNTDAWTGWTRPFFAGQKASEGCAAGALSRGAKILFGQSTPTIVEPIHASPGPVFLAAAPKPGSLGNQLLEPSNVVAWSKDPVQRRGRLGGLLSYYHREAAELWLR